MKLFCNILKEASKNLPFYSIDNGITEHKYKRFAELAIMFDYAKKYAENYCPKEEQIIRMFLIQQMKLVSSDRIFKNYYTAYHLILPYISIREFEKISHLESCLEIIVNNKMISSEIPPHRQMEWNHMMQKIGDIKEIVIPESSILNKTIHLQYISRELTYAITHALFYISDYGNQKPMVIINDAEKLEFILGTLIAKSALENDVDLLLELTINYISLHTLLTIDFDVLYFVYNSLNEVKFIEFNLNEEQTLKKYHTMFVLNLLCIQLKNVLASKETLTNKQKKLMNALLEGEISSVIWSKNKRHKFQDSWEIISALKSKNFKFSSVQQYYKRWEYCPQLSLEVESYINYLEDRTKRGIIWERECTELQLNNSQQLKLDEELLDLLSKEKRNLTLRALV
jgi:hypothetical protein